MHFFISYRQPTLPLFLRVDNFYSLNERLSLDQTKSMVSTSGVFSDAEVYLNVSPEGETAAAPPRTRKLSCARSHRSTNRTCGHDVYHLQWSLSQHSWVKLRLLRMQACRGSIFVILTIKKTTMLPLLRDPQVFTSQETWCCNYVSKVKRRQKCGLPGGKF